MCRFYWKGSVMRSCFLIWLITRITCHHIVPDTLHVYKFVTCSHRIIHFPWILFCESFHFAVEVLLNSVEMLNVIYIYRIYEQNEKPIQLAYGQFRLLYGLLWIVYINTLRPRKMTAIFQTIFFKSIFSNENMRISIEISLKFAPKGLINNIPALVQIMAWRRSGDKPFSEPMMVILLTRPQWVNLISVFYMTATIAGVI